MLEEFLAGGHVDAAVFALRPDYRALLLAVDGLVPGPSDETSEDLLQAAEAPPGEALSESRWSSCRTSRRGGRPTERSGRSRSGPATAWRHCCGVRRTGLPRVNRLTDLYNAVSVLHQIPLGGEDLTRYTGAPRLIRATGGEPFDTAADGSRGDRAPRTWRGGVVRRRRGDLSALELAAGPPHPARATTPRTALFILDALDPLTDDAAARPPPMTWSTS